MERHTSARFAENGDQRTHSTEASGIIRNWPRAGAWTVRKSVDVKGAWRGKDRVVSRRINGRRQDEQEDPKDIAVRVGLGCIMQNVLGVGKSCRGRILRRSNFRKLGQGVEETPHVRVGARGGPKQRMEARSKRMDIARIAL